MAKVESYTFPFRSRHMIWKASNQVMRGLCEPVDNSPLVLFRIVFGLLLFCETAGSIVTGWVKRVFIEPDFTFPMIGFDWLQPLPGNGMYVYYAVMAAVALLVMLGRHFHIALGAFTVMWTLTYLMQTVSYNNHYYLIILLCVLLVLTPANGYCSWDAVRYPAVRTLTCPRWCITVFIAQVAIMYFFAAVAKLDVDWLEGRPMALWLLGKRSYPVLGPLYGQAWFQWLMVYGGIAFDALIGPLLLWRRTRLLGLALAILFHLTNSYTFRIGVFPYLALSLCVFFFPPEAVRKRFFKSKPGAEAWGAQGGMAGRHQSLVFAFLSLYFLVQLFLPLRHWLYPGNVHWTEEGHHMAWRMMLRTKSGTISFVVKEPKTGKSWTVHPQSTLNAKQAHRLATRPDMIWQFSQRLKKAFAAQGIEPVEIYANSQVSLNSRHRQALVDPTVNLAEVEWSFFKPADWLVPLRE